MTGYTESFGYNRTLYSDVLATATAECFIGTPARRSVVNDGIVGIIKSDRASGIGITAATGTEESANIVIGDTHRAVSDADTFSGSSLPGYRYIIIALHIIIQYDETRNVEDNGARTTALGNRMVKRSLTRGVEIGYIHYFAASSSMCESAIPLGTGKGKQSGLETPYRSFRNDSVGIDTIDAPIVDCRFALKRCIVTSVRT